MKQKVLKLKSELFKQEVTITIDEELNKLKGKILSPRILAEANNALRRLKDFLPR